MPIKLSKRDRRIAALLILLGVIGAVASAALLPVLIASQNYEGSIKDLRFKLEKYEQTGRLESSLKARLSRLASQGMSDEDLLAGASTAIAGANLQALMKQRVGSSNGRLVSTQILPASSDGNMDRISIRAQFTGDIEALQRTLYTIEFSRPLLFVDNLQIQAKRQSRRRIRRPRRNSAATTAGVLTVSLDVSGYHRNEGQQ